MQERGKQIFWGAFLGVIILFVSAMGGAVSAARGASLEEIQARGILRGGVPDFRLYPFAFSENGVILGFDVDLVQAIADALKVRLELVPVPWGGVALAWDPLYSWDRYDLVAATISITPERDKVCDFSVPYFASGQAVSVLPNSGILSLEQLRGKKIATPGKTTSEKVARNFFGDASIVVLDNIPECYDALLKKEVAGTVTDLATILLEPKVRSGEIQVLSKTLSREWYAVALPPDEPELRQFVNHVVENTKDVLYRKWLEF